MASTFNVEERFYSDRGCCRQFVIFSVQERKLIGARAHHFKWSMQTRHTYVQFGRYHLVQISSSKKGNCFEQSELDYFLEER